MLLNNAPRSCHVAGSYLLLTCLCAYLLLNSGAASASKPLKDSLLPLPLPLGPDPGLGRFWSERVVLVAVLDGTLHAIDAQSGAHLWSFTSGAPLVSTGSNQLSPSGQRHQQTRDDANASSEVSSEAINEFDGEDEVARELPSQGSEVVFPGVDGTLYAYQPGQAVQKLPITARELVAASPSVTRDGNLVLGSRQSAVFVLDSRTGKVLRKFKSKEESPEALAGAARDTIGKDAEELTKSGGQEGVEPDDHPDALLVLRTDYTVRSLDLESGLERWNVSVGELSTLFNPFARDVGPSTLQPGGGRYKEQLIADKDNSLRRVDPATGEVAWRTIFGSTPVAVYSSSGVQLLTGGTPGLEDHVYVGMLEGQLYALPAGSQSGPAILDKSGKVTRADPPHLPPPDPTTSSLHQLVPVGTGGLIQTYEDLLCAPSPEKIKEQGEAERQGNSIVVRNYDPLPQMQPLPALSHLQPPAQPPLPPPSPPRASMVLVIVVGILGAALATGFGVWLGGKGQGFFWLYVGVKKPGAGDGLQPQQTGASGRRKKGKKAASGGHIGNGRTMLEEREAGQLNGESKGNSSPDLRLLTNGEGVADGHWIGRLLVGSKIIGYGSHGTLVLEGQLEGRPVAVKRLLSQFHEKARKEIAALIASDEHPNVVRCFAMEEDAAFVYVALERCWLSLSDLVLACSNNQEGSEGVDQEKVEAAMELAAKMGCKQLKGLLWDSAGRPTAILLQILRDVVAGLAHVHELGIVHRDLKPQNVLISTARGPGGQVTLRAKLSDMGISKRLLEGDNSFDPNTTGMGSAGWQAPEQLQHGRQTRAVDMFALGCVLFFCVSGGEHPFGSRFERDANIVKGLTDLFPVEHLPEAQHLLHRLLSPDPSTRLVAAEVQRHPLLWGSEQRLAFLRDASDRVEGEDREEGSVLLAAMEAVAPIALGGSWNEKLDAGLLDNLGKYRRYNFKSVRDLLRVIRNKCNHYRELPQPLQELLGPVPEGYELYFRTRFPRLLMECYCVLFEHCLHDHIFKRYFCSAEHSPHFQPY